MKEKIKITRLLILITLIIISLTFIKGFQEKNKQELNSPQISNINSKNLFEEHTQGDKKKVYCFGNKIEGIKCYDQDSLKRTPYHCGNEFSIQGDSESISCENELTCNVVKEEFPKAFVKAVENKPSCPKECPTFTKTGEYYSGSCSIIIKNSLECVYSEASALIYGRCS